MTKYKFDLDKLSLSDLVLIADGKADIAQIFLIMNKACNVDLMDESFSNLVYIMGSFQEEIAQRSEDIAIALGSLRWNIEDKEGS